MLCRPMPGLSIDATEETPAEEHMMTTATQLLDVSSHLLSPCTAPPLSKPARCAQSCPMCAADTV